MRYLMIGLVFTLLGVGCGKEKHSCYDPTLAKEYKNKMCIQTGYSPPGFNGFEGCDGNIYDSECAAAKNGIGPK